MEDLPRSPKEVLRMEKAEVRRIKDGPAKLKCISSEEGFTNIITEKNLYRPQLALAGYIGLFNYKQIQIFGKTEMYFLKSLSKQNRIKAFSTLVKFPVPGIVITNGQDFFPELLAIANEEKIPIFVTEYDTTKAFFMLSEYLDDLFADQTNIHGAFVDVYGVGILFMGKSGIGKSEVALDLIERGHRLVADDSVMVTKKGEKIVLGCSTNLNPFTLEVRGIGIIDVKHMFGIRATRTQKRLEIIVYLELWDSKKEYERLGIDETTIKVLGCPIPYIVLPVTPGKNITVIAESIALRYLLNHQGYSAAQVFSERHAEAIKRRRSPESAFIDSRLVTYFHGDKE